MVMLIQAHASHLPLPDESAHCVVTSPPYWGLRDYGLKSSVWPAAFSKRNRYEPATCQHIWGDDIIASANDSNRASIDWATGGDPAAKLMSKRPSQGAFCGDCEAWRGVLGLEPTPELYVQHILEIFREVRRVLRKDGTLWLNIGDSYARKAAKGEHKPGKAGKHNYIIENTGGAAANMMHFLSETCGSSDGEVGRANRACKRNSSENLKPKDLCGIPWRIALALQADGWWLRSDIIWSKPNPMPESVTDRPTSAHEYIFLLTKSAKYFYDAEAIKESSETLDTRRPYTSMGAWQIDGRPKSQRHGGEPRDGEAGGYRNRRTVWEIPTQPYIGGHFATFPEALVQPCIAAGTSERGCCPKCGAPWERQIESTGHVNSREPAHVPNRCATKTDSSGWGPTTRATNRWQPSCRCNAGDPVTATVLDPFVGSGTVCEVAYKMGRHAVGVDLKLDYLKMAKERIPPLAFYG